MSIKLSELFGSMDEAFNNQKLEEMFNKTKDVAENMSKKSAERPVWQRPSALKRSAESFRAIRKCRYPLSCQQESVWQVCCPVL